jgi:hypothetical protein
MAYIYGNVLKEKAYVYPCLNYTRYGAQIIGEEGTFKLPVEHRTKPTDLISGMTSRALQYSFVRKCGHFVRIKPYKECGGNWGTWEYHNYPMETYLADPPVVNWELALRNKIQDDKVSFAEMIGEWRESVGYIHGATHVLARAWKNAKKAWRLRHNRRALKRWFQSQFKRKPTSKFELMDAVSVDLAIKFGINPLIGQLTDSLERLEKVRLAYRRLQVTVSDQNTRTVAGPVSGSCRSVYDRSVRAVAFVKYDVDSLEFTAGNLGESLWAGTSLSFMLDYFWDISSYLSSFNAMKGVTAFVAAISTRDRVTVVSDHNSQLGDWVCKTPHTYLKRSYKRDVIHDIPFAHLPKPKLPDSYIWKRLFSASEVLATMRHSRH